MLNYYFVFRGDAQSFVENQAPTFAPAMLWVSGKLGTHILCLENQAPALIHQLQNKIFLISQRECGCLVFKAQNVGAWLFRTPTASQRANVGAWYSTKLWASPCKIKFDIFRVC